ncbi:MAG TPA: hypothetical protein VH372_26160, partial [Actinospica sp.]|nr:hypothetical protein [Actinospica sp.]
MSVETEVSVAAPAAGTAPAGADSRRIGRLHRVTGFPEFGVLLAVLLIGLFFTVTNAQFASPGGMSNWTDVASTTGMVAVPVTLLMIGGEFDLSAGVMVGSSGLVVAILTTRYGLNFWLAIAAALVFAAVIGLVNGLVVVKTGLPSFIVTLAMLLSLEGANLGVTSTLTGTVS